MGASAYVGRVGALAVALGVGVAVATGYGVSAADPSGAGSPSPGNNSAESASPEKDSNPAASTAGQELVSPTGSPSSTGTHTGSSAGTGTSASGSASATSSTSTGTESGDAGTGGVVSTGGAQLSTKTGAGTPALPVATLPQSSVQTSPAGADLPAATLPATRPSSGPKETPPAGGTSTGLLTTSGKSTLESAHTASTPASSPKLDSKTTLQVSAPTLKSVSSDTLADFAPSALTRSALPQLAAAAPMTATTQSVALLAPSAITPVSTAPTVGLPGIVTTVLSALGLAPQAANGPAAPAQPTALWGLLAWARREFEQGLSNLFKSPTAANPVVATQPANLTLSTAASGTPDALAMTAATPAALAAAAAASPGFPTPGAQLSASTSFVNWVTGNYPVNNTLDRFGISGTDVGVIWDNGIPDNPNTPVNEHQVLIAFGDTFGNHAVPGEEWRSNTLFRSSDAFLADGLSVANGQFLGTGPESTNVFAGSPLDRTQWLQFGRTFSKNLLANPNLGSAVTLIPTSAISVPTPGTKYGATQYMSFMAVQQWGSPGQWTTSYSALASSVDNGESWQVAPQTVRYNQWNTGNQNFQQSAMVRPGDGFVYVYGTPNGRQGSAYVARVPEASVLDLTKYDYWSGGTQGFFGFGATPAGWYKNQPAQATAIMPPAGACPGAGAGNTVGEMSVQYNSYLKKFVAVYTDQNNSVVMRTASQPQGTWSDAKVLLTQQPGGIYAPMLHPWSPSTLGTGTDLYWNLSLSSEYNVMLMKTDLSKV
jgi:hypothetical protein